MTALLHTAHRDRIPHRASGGAAQELGPGERISYLRPSRYADVDRLEATVRALFADVRGEGTEADAGVEADDVALLRAATLPT